MLLKQTLLGVIDAIEHKYSLAELTMNRSIDALPFGGRYRLVDFILSNMVNCGITNVAIFPKSQYRSLMDHIGTGKYWDLNRKKDGLFFFPAQNLHSYQDEGNSFQQYEQHIDYFLKSTQKYVLIANSYTVCNLNFKDVLKSHIESECDITEIRHLGKSLNMFICEKSLLLTFIKTRGITGYKNIVDVMNDSRYSILVNYYNYKGYIAIIDTIEAYFKHNLGLIQPQNWKQLFRKEAPIFTKVKDEPPTKYTDTAYVKNAIIANGCIVEGHVENSILFSGVRIEKGARVKNSIIMHNSRIRSHAFIENAILDKNVLVEDSVKIVGMKDMPFVIQKGKIQGALMNS